MTLQICPIDQHIYVLIPLGAAVAAVGVLINGHRNDEMFQHALLTGARGLSQSWKTQCDQHLTVETWSI